MSKKQQQLEKEILNDFEAVIDSQPDESTPEQQPDEKEAQAQPETQTEPAQEQQPAPETAPEQKTEPAPEQKTEPEAAQTELFTETQQEREERRGRKKLPRDKDGKIIREEAKPEQTKGDLNDFLKDFQKQEEQPAAPAPAGAAAPAKMQMDVSKFINGAIFLMIMDAVFPMAFTWILSFINPKYKNIKPEARQKLKLTKEEKEMLEEGANEVVKYLFSESDPLTIFAVSMCFVYYSKFDSLTKEDFI